MKDVRGCREYHPTNFNLNMKRFSTAAVLVIAAFGAVGTEGLSPDDMVLAPQDTVGAAQILGIPELAQDLWNKQNNVVLSLGFNL